MDRVQEYYRVDFLQRYGPPLGYLRHDLVGYSADQAGRYVNAVDILHLVFNVAGRHSLSVHAADLLFDGVGGFFMLLDDLRFELGAAVTRDIGFGRAVF